MTEATIQIQKCVVRSLCIHICKFLTNRIRDGSLRLGKKVAESNRTPKINKHFHVIRNSNERFTDGENKCTSDFVGVTNRLKDDTGSPNQ